MSGIDLSNPDPGKLKAFYNKLASFDPKPDHMWAMGKFLVQRYVPNRVTTRPGSKEKLIDRARRNLPTYFILNHVLKDDQYPFVSALGAQGEEFKKLIYPRLRFLTKAEYLDKDNDDNDDIGLAPEQMIPLGAVPVIRPGTAEEAAEIATPMLTDAVAEMMVRGNDPAGFLEGTRNRTSNPHEVQKARKGPAHMALRAIELGADPAFAIVGISYGADNNARTSANIHFGPVIEDFPRNGPNAATEITALLHEHLQDAVYKSLSTR